MHTNTRLKFFALILFPSSLGARNQDLAKKPRPSVITIVSLLPYLLIMSSNHITISSNPT